MKLTKKIIYDEIYRVAKQKTDIESASIIAQKIVDAEFMNASTHGIHYFNRVIFPFLKENDFSVEITGNILQSENHSVEGIVHTTKLVGHVSNRAKKTGVAIGFTKNPGKIGALRVYAPSVISKGQTLMIFKNTAKIMGTELNPEPIFGTNPFCFALAKTDFVFDSSTTIVATNKLRIFKKTHRKFKFPIGVDDYNDLTNDPTDVLQGNHSMLPFSTGNLWYKSFFISMFIEGIAAMAGGFTSGRVGDHTGNRFYSKEGLSIIVVDTNHLLHKTHYEREVEKLIKDVKKKGYRIPGVNNHDYVDVLDIDWQELKSL